MINKLPKVILMFFVLTTIVSFAGRIAVLNTYLTKGNDVKNYEKDLALLTKENTILQGKIADMSSLTYVAEEAKKLGMLAPSTTSFLTKPTAASAITPESSRF